MSFKDQFIVPGTFTILGKDFPYESTLKLEYEIDSGWETIKETAVFRFFWDPQYHRLSFEVMSGGDWVFQGATESFGFGSIPTHIYSVERIDAKS